MLELLRVDSNVSSSFLFVVPEKGFMKAFNPFIKIENNYNPSNNPFYYLLSFRSSLQEHFQS